MKTISRSGVLLVAALMTWAAPPSLTTYRFGPDQSSIQIDVRAGGLFKFLGHDHTIVAKKYSGTVQFDPDKLEDSSVFLRIESNSLTVLDPSVSEKDRSEVQATMAGPKVLDVHTFPEITFSSRQVRKATRAGDESVITLTGMLNLHGIEKEMILPVRISLQGGLLRARGTATITQTDFSMVPVKAGGGAVRVKDQVKVNFDVLAEKKS